MKRVTVLFFRTLGGNEPVREFLRALSGLDRSIVGRAISEVEFGWPIGMPLTRALGSGLHEVRVKISGGRQCRIFFFISPLERMILLHAAIKKTQKTPKVDFEVAKSRMSTFLHVYQSSRHG